MAELVMTVKFDETHKADGRVVLKVAKHTIELLRALERNITGKRRATQLWDINIYTHTDCAVVEFTARRNGKALAFDLEDARELLAKAQPTKPAKEGHDA